MQASIMREQVLLVMQQLPVMQVSSFIVALVLAYAVRDRVSVLPLVLWVLLVLAVAAGRVALYYRFARVRAGEFDGRAWKDRYLLLALASGLVWGLSAFLVFPAGDPTFMSLFVLVMASLSASTTVSHASLRLAPTAWAGPVMLSYAGRCFLEGGGYGYSIGFLIVLYLATVLSYSFRHNRTITQSITLRFENLGLLEEVRKANELLQRDIAKRVQTEKERDALIADLQRAVTEIRALQGILPVCSSCKKIRDDQGTWQPLETYISEHSAAKFSHGYCPDCGKKALDEARSVKKGSEDREH
jgi:hypothetical protein